MVTCPRQEEAIAWLERDAIFHVAQLKMLSTFPGIATAEPLIDGLGAVRGAFVSLPVAASDFDRQAYPRCDTIAMPVTDEPMLALAIAARQACIPTVWKMFPELAIVLATQVRLQRVTAFVSYSGSLPPGADPLVVATEHPPGHWQRLLPHAAAETLRNSIHFGAGDDPQAEPQCIVRAWPIHADIWEIGGLYTRPESRGRGWATRAVKAAVACLCARGLRVRYAVREDNVSSRAVALRVGLTEIAQLEHWVSRPPSPASVGT